MDIKEKIEDIVKKIKDNDSFKEEFEKEPIKAVEKVLGVDLPDDIIEKVIDGVKAKLSADTVSKAVDAFKKLF